MALPPGNSLTFICGNSTNCCLIMTGEQSHERLQGEQKGNVIYMYEYSKIPVIRRISNWDAVSGLP